MEPQNGERRFAEGSLQQPTLNHAVFALVNCESRPQEAVGVGTLFVLLARPLIVSVLHLNASDNSGMAHACWDTYSKVQDVQGFEVQNFPADAPIMELFGRGSTPMVPFGVGAPPILEPTLVVGLGCSLVWVLTHGHFSFQWLRSKTSRRTCGRKIPAGWHVPFNGPVDVGLEISSSPLRPEQLSKSIWGSESSTGAWSWEGVKRSYLFLVPAIPFLSLLAF